MIKRLKKKAFTLVELLVVIAILAILATAGIVGYTSFTKKAEISNDNSLVAELNNYVVAAKVSKDFNTVSEVRDELIPSGIDLAKLTPSAKNHGYSYGFDIKDDKFVLLEGTSLAEGYSVDKTIDVFVLVKNEAKATEYMNAGYSVYLQAGYDKTTVNASKGVDVGENTSITTVNYANTAEQTVVIRTNSAYTNVVINAPTDVVKHYGNANSINITAVAMGSYHEYGSVATLNVKAGKIDINKDAYIGMIAVDKGATASSVILENSGTIFATEVITYNATTYEHEVITNPTDEQKAIIDTVTPTDASSVLKVGSAEALINLASAQSQGIITGSLSIELKNNIDLTGKTWVPFGQNKQHAFEGTIDGKNHSIIGMSNNGYTGELYTTSSTHFTGDNYGLIADATGVVEVKNITFKNVDIDGISVACGVVIGRTCDSNDSGVYNYYASKVTLTNVHVDNNSKIYGQDKISGLIGYVAGVCNKNTKGYSVCKVYVENCSVAADIKATSKYRAGGLFGYIGDSGQVKVSNNCSFSGKVGAELSSSSKWVGGLFGAIGKSQDFPISITVSGFTLLGTVEEPSVTSPVVVIKTSNNISIGVVQGRPGAAQDPGTTYTGISDYVASEAFTISTNNKENPLA